MSMESAHLKIVLILTFGFAFASVLGYLTQRAKLSPLLGYLLAGYLIGPFSPGYVADLEIAEQLAEIGVILMMFGVGMHFKWEDLSNVRNIAIAGAILQTLATTTVSAMVIHSVGWSWEAGIIIGIAIGVASTVVLIRVLDENHLLQTIQGHIAVGWLIVEDVVTVIALLLLPTFAASLENIQFSHILYSIGIVLLKFVFLIALLFTIGRKLASYVFCKITQTHSHELFTLTVLALIFIIATGSTVLFGTSIALGAFIAGMVIGQTHIRHEAAINSLPLKDIFVVVFFLSVGMLFNPAAILEHFYLFIILLGIILIVKPLVAFLIVIFAQRSVHTALTVAISLAQIGEFSFILAEEGLKFKIIPEAGYDIIVACALVSISINPLFFKLVHVMSGYLPKNGSAFPQNQRIALIVGDQEMARHAIEVLTKMEFTIALRGEVLEEELQSADLLIVASYDPNETFAWIHQARALNSQVQIIAWIASKADQSDLIALGVHAICSEKECDQAFNELIFKMFQAQKM